MIAELVEATKHTQVKRKKANTVANSRGLSDWLRLLICNHMDVVRVDDNIIIGPNTKISQYSIKLGLKVYKNFHSSAFFLSLVQKKRVSREEHTVSDISISAIDLYKREH